MKFYKWNNYNGRWLPICDSKDELKRKYAEPEREKSGPQAEPNPSEAGAPPTPPPPPPEKLPDLIVSSLYVAPSGSPDVVFVEVTVSNIGEADAGPFTVTISDQPAGGSFSWGGPITLTPPFPPDPHLITAFADALYQVEESNENNNAKQAQIP